MASKSRSGASRAGPENFSDRLGSTGGSSARQRTTMAKTRAQEEILGQGMFVKGLR
jgi:hypothetical protein